MASPVQDSSRPRIQILDIFALVEELHDLSAKEMNKLLRDSSSCFVLLLKTGRGSSIRVDVERLVLALPLHLLACLASKGTELHLRYLLHGVRLLHSLSDLAVRHQKLEQLMLQEVKLREQILDLVIYMLITLASNDQEGRLGSSALLHAALVACSLYLLPAFVATEWLDVVPVLLAHPMVNMFMDAAFDAVRRDIGLLHNKLRILNSKLINGKMTLTGAECVVQLIGQQCEASIQVLQSLCQPHVFRDEVLKHKELCRRGGLLRLAITILKLQLPCTFQESKYLTALISRIQSKTLSMMAKFCETESVSFLDELAIEPRTMHLAESVAGEVLALVRFAIREDPRRFQGLTENLNPIGLLYINAMHLADIFSDDSNFRNFVMDYITSDFTQVLAQAPSVFTSGWCGSGVDFDASKSGSDAVLVYDPFRAAGAAMQSFKGCFVSSSRTAINSSPLADEYSGCSLSSEQIQPASYAQERASLFVKIIANLHCFNPDICAADEKDRFLKIFVDSLTKCAFNRMDTVFFLSTVQTAVRICENLLFLIEHVSCLPSEVVSDEDVQLVSTFYDALHDAICPGVAEPSFHEDPVVGYVRDAHEQKRRTIFAQRLQSERWQRIQQYSEISDKEQSTSNNNTVTKPPSSQQNVDEDICQTSENAESNGNRSFDKRNQEIVDPGDEVEEAQTNKQVGESRVKEEIEADLMDTEEMESKCLIESLVKIDAWDRESNEVQSTSLVENTMELDALVMDSVIGQNIDPHGDEVKCEKEKESSGRQEMETININQYDYTCIDASKSVQNDEAKLETRELDATVDGNQMLTPSNDIKHDDAAGGNVGDIEIHGNARDTDYHKDTDKMLKEINLENCENLIDDIYLKTEIDIGQDSHNTIGNTRGSTESESKAIDTHAIHKCIVTTALGEETQSKKRKRNIMNEKQMIVIENALKTEPDMQRYPKLIEQWTTQLNKIGPELSFQQLKNWLNNRKAKLARKAREARGLEGETQVCIFETDCLSSMDLASQSKPVSRHGGSYSGNPSEHNSVIEDGQVRESGSFKRTGIPGMITGMYQPKHVDDDLGNRCSMELESYYTHGCEFPDVTKVQGASRVSASVKFVKCEVGQYVSLLDTEGNEVAHGIINQVDGKWEGKKLDEQGLCIVKIINLKVDRSMRLPHPSAQSGCTFQENEALFGQLVVAWDTNRIFLLS